jgi:phosphatidylserine/phosphatidylglycerophosphate/cardiolipin synthase-like enzyme
MARKTSSPKAAHRHRGSATRPEPGSAPAPVSNTNHISASKDGLTVTAYRGDSSVLLGFDINEHQTDDLAGFAVKLTPPSGKPSWLLNRLSFNTPLGRASTPEERQKAWTPSNEAPFQKFRWQHFPPQVTEGFYQYEVTAMRFTGRGAAIEEGPKVDVELRLVPSDFGALEIGFTRSYMSSQAYFDRFGNDDIRPTPKTLDYSTKPFEEQYAFLGFHARQLVFEFLDECIRDRSITVDAFVYDIDEPDIVADLQKLGKRLRMFADNAPLHDDVKALEPKVWDRIRASAGDDHVKTGHFNRFAHDKILIQSRDGKPVKVLTGSANFSVRGLYVQANNVLVFDDPDVAGLYSKVFAEVWADSGASGRNGLTRRFTSSTLAKQWFSDIRKSVLPPFEIAFSPHADAALSLDKVATAIENAKSSVLFAVMELGGKGPVLAKLQSLSGDRRIFSYGITQNLSGRKGEETTDGVTVQAPGRGKGGVLVPFAFLSKNVPAPFNQEVSGGMGQVIHNKFVVVDFNGSSPAVFTGSSNLAQGGEQQNGDNLLAIYDRSIATLYAVEAVRLVDHFDFRAALHNAKSKPLRLKTKDEKWWAPYFDSGNEKFTERRLFVM